MSTQTAPVQNPALAPPSEAGRDVLLLQPGDRLTRDEFERRYAAMPELKKAELIDGVVYIMPSPVSATYHEIPQHGIAFAEHLKFVERLAIRSPAG